MWLQAFGMAGSMTLSSAATCSNVVAVGQEACINDLRALVSFG
jgi:hypothetical protein